MTKVPERSTGGDPQGECTEEEIGAVEEDDDAGAAQEEELQHSDDKKQETDQPLLPRLPPLGALPFLFTLIYIYLRDIKRRGLAWGL